MNEYILVFPIRQCILTLEHYGIIIYKHSLPIITEYCVKMSVLYNFHSEKMKYVYPFRGLYQQVYSMSYVGINNAARSHINK